MSEQSERMKVASDALLDVSTISKTCGYFVASFQDDDKCSHPQNRSRIDTFLYCGNHECPIRRQSSNTRSSGGEAVR